MGGGSSIDTAKAASVCALSGESIHKYLDGNPDKIEIKNTLPVIAIPTTSGTGSEVSQYAVITDEKSLRKDSITSEHIYPKVAIVDPVLTTGLSVRLTIDTGLDVLSSSNGIPCFLKLGIPLRRYWHWKQYERYFSGYLFV